MADTLESLEIEVKHSASDAATEIGKITSSLTTLGKRLEKVLPQLEALALALKGINSPITINDVHGNTITNAVQKASSEVKPQEIATPVNAMVQEMISGASEVELLQLKLEQLNAAMQQAFSEGNAEKAAQIRMQIVSTEKALERAEKAAKGTAKGIKELSKEASKSKSPLDTFISSLKRIAFYRIIRGILKSITQAFQEGLEKAYLFSQGVSGEGNRFAQAMDGLKSKSNEMKGQLGSAFISLLAAIQPVLIAIINLVTKAADAISQFFSAFTGKTYLKANATAANFADTMERGGAAAKEWKNQLLGFDEINRLNEPSSGGGGGGSNPLDGYAFEDAPINQKLLDFVNGIKEKVQPAIDRLKKSFERLKEAWDRFIDNFDGSKLLQFWGDIPSVGITNVANLFTVLLDTLTLIVDVLDALNTGDWTNVWFDFKQLLYDILILIADFMVGLTNLVMDVFIIFAKSIDDIIGTHFADYLQADKDAFNEMYTASRDSTDGLFGLKKAMGLTEDSMEDVSVAAQAFTDDLIDVGSQSEKTEKKVGLIRSAVDFVLDGFRFFGEEVSWIITSLFSPLADLCDWIDSALRGFSLLSGVNNPRYDIWSDPGAWTSNFATGGFPSEGSLFFASERGPELVGTMGGRSAVANQQEIVEGIRQGVYDAVLAANGNGGGEVNVKVYLDSREIKAGQERLARAWG